jgi:hypothetical protein
LGPVLAFGAACAGMNGEISVIEIVFAREVTLQLEFAEFRLELIVLTLELVLEGRVMFFFE